MGPEERVVRAISSLMHALKDAKQARDGRKQENYTAEKSDDLVSGWTTSTGRHIGMNPSVSLVRFST